MEGQNVNSNETSQHSPSGCCADCVSLNSVQLEEKVKKYLAKNKWKCSDFARYPLLLETFNEYQNQDSMRHFDFYCAHHLKSNEHIEEYKEWYNTAFPKNTWFIDNLKYVRGNTYEENERVINNYLRVNELED